MSPSIVIIFILFGYYLLKSKRRAKSNKTVVDNELGASGAINFYIFSKNLAELSASDLNENKSLSNLKQNLAPFLSTVKENKIETANYVFDLNAELANESKPSKASRNLKNNPFIRLNNEMSDQIKVSANPLKAKMPDALNSHASSVSTQFEEKDYSPLENKTSFTDSVWTTATCNKSKCFPVMPSPVSVRKNKLKELSFTQMSRTSYSVKEDQNSLFDSVNPSLFKTDENYSTGANTSADSSLSFNEMLHGKYEHWPEGSRSPLGNSTFEYDGANIVSFKSFDSSATPDRSSKPTSQKADSTCISLSLKHDSSDNYSTITNEIKVFDQVTNDCLVSLQANSKSVSFVQNEETELSSTKELFNNQQNAMYVMRRLSNDYSVNKIQHQTNN